MIIYVFLFSLICLNSILFRNKKKMFIIISFFYLFVVAGLRKYTVGIDLAGHYAKNYVLISKMPWNELREVMGQQFAYYDAGWIIFLRILGIVSSNAQWFIVATSAFVCYAMGKYLLHHSDDVYFETFLYLTTFTYFMYMNIIAQSVAIAIVLLSVDYLEKKKYIHYIMLILLAASIHGSAIVCLIFIPLFQMKQTKKNIRRFIYASILSILIFDNYLVVLVQCVLPQFVYYLKNDYAGRIDFVRLMHLMVYVLCLTVGCLARWYFKSRYEDDPRNNQFPYEQKIISQALPFNFLFYITILSVLMRMLVYKLYIFSRMGFYFYPFACSFMVKSVNGIKTRRLRQQIKYLICGGMILFFLILLNSLRTAYGVLPYEFFWE